LTLNDDELDSPVYASQAAFTWQSVIAIIAGAATVAILFAVGAQGGALGFSRIVLGLVYVLYVPGYALSGALFPTGLEMDGVARSAASIGLSVLTVPFMALLLDQLPWGIRPLPILIGELMLIGVACVFAVIRRPARSFLEVAGISLPGARRMTLAQAGGSGFLVFTAGFLLLVLAGSWVMYQATADRSTTEFYMLGPGGQALGFPRTGAMNQELTVTLGIVNREPSSQQYRAEIWIADPLGTGRKTRVAQAGPITLAAGHTVEVPVAWRLPWRSQDEQVSFLLFRGTAPQPFRRLWLWLNPATPVQSQ
jgi:uncharacterized membrane protein